MSKPNEPMKPTAAVAQRHASKRLPVVPTPAEDAAIDVGMAADPSTFELTHETVARMQRLRKAGRPRLDAPKEMMTMRVDADVLKSIKASGEGWQTRVNALLRDAVKNGKLHA